MGVFVFQILFFMTLAWGGEKPPEILLGPSEKEMINANHRVSEWLDGVAESLDLFLAGDVYSNRQNTTRVEIETSAYYNEFEGFSSTLNFNVDLKLPNTEQYWLLTFNSYDEQDDRGVRNDVFRQAPRTQNVGAALSWMRRLGEIKTTFRPRLGFAGGLPAISHSLMFESILEQPGEYWLNPRLEFYANPNRGAGAFQALNFFKRLSPIYGVTLINEGDYQSRTHLYLVTHGISIGKNIDNRRAINYNIYGTFTNTPNHQLDVATISVMWRHNIYPNVFRYEILPNISFAQKYKFAGNGGLTLNGYFIF